MKRRIGYIIFFYSLLLQPLMALDITAPAAYSWQNPNGVDYLFFFKDFTNPEIIFSEKIEKLYRMNDNYTDSILLADSDMTDWLNVEAETYYIAHSADGRKTFFVFDYSQLRLQLDALEPDNHTDEQCEELILNLTGTIPDIRYRSQYGGLQTINREAELSYTTQSWNGTEWADSTVTTTKILRSQFIVDAPLKNTTFILKGDQIAEELGLPQDSIESPEYEAVAVAAEPTTVVTTRGTTAENEVERPIDPAMEPISGSAPLDVLFKANGSDKVKYYSWRFLKGNDLLAERTNEEEERYTFDDFGEYRVQLVVSNDVCETDTIEIPVSVSASQLLVPNVFTPNGDGMNDEFRVMYRSIVEFEIWVYNRWGKLVYHSTDPAKGWDGKIGNAKAAEGAYYYVIRAKGADAEEGQKFIRKSKYKKGAPIGIYQLSGDINLLRGKQ